MCKRGGGGCLVLSALVRGCSFHRESRVNHGGAQPTGVDRSVMQDVHFFSQDAVADRRTADDLQTSSALLEDSVYTLKDTEGVSDFT